jgi:hypothetical protein
MGVDRGFLLSILGWPISRFLEWPLRDANPEGQNLINIPKITGVLYYNCANSRSNIILG